MLSALVSLSASCPSVLTETLGDAAGEKGLRKEWSPLLSGGILCACEREASSSKRCNDYQPVQMHLLVFLPVVQVFSAKT